jgi:hypothetical protein
MFKNSFLILILVLVLIVIFISSKNEYFGLQDAKLQKCLNDCNRRDIQMAKGYSSAKECQRSC